MLNNKFRASQFYAYKAVKLSGISIIEKVLKNNKKQLLIFGIRISAKQECSGYKIKKMCGIYKTKKNSRRKIRTLFGIKIDEKQYKPNSDYNYYNNLSKQQHSIIFKNFYNINKGKEVVLFACSPGAEYK